MSTTETGMTAKEVLAKALALMNDGGKHWTKGDYEVPGEDGLAYCSVGAIGKITYAADGGSVHGITGLDDLHDRSIELLASAVPDRFFGGERPWKRVIVWNDAEETTWEDVVQVFTKAQEMAT